MRHRLALAALFAALAPASALAQTAARDNIDSLIEVQARANKVPSAFVHRVVKRESNYNPHARGGSALGLMQIKHATARGLGYKGEAAGLYDPETNLKYGIAYLAGAYRAAKGDLDRAYQYYNRGYYYAAKQLGITTEVADDTPATPAATSATGFAGLFGLRTGSPVATASADPAAGSSVAGTPALAYAAGGQAVAAVEVPLPPRRPSALGASVETAATAAPEPTATAADATPARQAVAVLGQSSDAVEVPLPPRRPSITLLAAATRPVLVHRSASVPVQEATAITPAQ